jgi:hypothetical protein
LNPPIIRGWLGVVANGHGGGTPRESVDSTRWLNAAVCLSELLG